MEKLAILGGKKVRTEPFFSSAIIGEEERKRVNEVLDSGNLSGFIAKAGDNFLGGKQVKEFEALVREYFAAKHVVSVNSATAGLHAALAACGVGPGDEVVVTPYTMSASATAILMVNAVPVFADIDAETFCLDPKQVEKALTPRTKAIVVVHLFGHPAPMDEIMALARKHKLFVIEDCAQSPGAKYKGKFAGLIGNIGVFSLNQHKTVTSGEGGFNLTDDPELALRMQLVRNHGEVIVQDMQVERLDDIVGYNYRMTELEAAVSLGQFRRLDELNSQRIALAVYLAEKLSAMPGLSIPKVQNGCKHVYFTFPIRFNARAAGISRALFAKAVAAEGIPVGCGYVKPIYLEPTYQKQTAHGTSGCPFTCSRYNGRTKYEKGLCPVCERMHFEELLVTPVCRHPHTIADMDDVIRAFSKVFDNRETLNKSEAG